MGSRLSLLLMLLAAIVPVILISGCSDLAGCSETHDDMHLCGYCAEDRMLSDNPNAGQCRYCQNGYDCSYSDICGELKCVSGGTSGGGSSGGGTGYKNQMCSNGWCYSGGICCPSSARFYCKGYCYNSADANAAGCYTLKATCY